MKAQIAFVVNCKTQKAKISIQVKENFCTTQNRPFCYVKQNKTKKLPNLIYFSLFNSHSSKDHQV